MEDVRALRIKETTDKIVTALNEQDEGPIGDRLHAIAFVAAWLILHIGGKANYQSLKMVFSEMMDGVANGLDAEQQASAEQSAEAVREMVNAQYQARN